MNKSTFNLTQFVRPNVAVLQPYSSARDEFTSTGDTMVFLDANENPFDTVINRYPDPHQRQVKEKLGTIKQVHPDNILLGNGSDEVLDLLFRAFCEPKEANVISLPPTYGMYKVLAATNAVENREVLLTKAFQPDVSGILAVTDVNSRILFLCSPNNPTANSFDKKLVKELLENFNGLVVIDEAYIDFCEDSGWLPELLNYPNLVITQTFSKAFGMAGIRLGICYASKEIIEVLQKIKPPYNVNELTQQYALNALDNVEKIQLEIKSILSERKLLSKELLEIPFISKVYASDANFILVVVDNADERYKELLALGIVVRNRTKQPLCNNTLRITIGTPEENRKLIAALKQINS